MFSVNYALDCEMQNVTGAIRQFTGIHNPTFANILSSSDLHDIADYPPRFVINCEIEYFLP